MLLKFNCFDSCFHWDWAGWELARFLEKLIIVFTVVQLFLTTCYGLSFTECTWLHSWTMGFIMKMLNKCSGDSVEHLVFEVWGLRFLFGPFKFKSLNLKKRPAINRIASYSVGSYPFIPFIAVPEWINYEQLISVRVSRHIYNVKNVTHIVSNLYTTFLYGHL